MRDYLNRYLKRLDRKIYRLRQQDAQFTQWRVVFFVGGMVLALLLSRVHEGLAGLVLALTLLSFGVLVYHHRRVQVTLAQFEAWRGIKETHLARLDLDWTRLARPRYVAPPHHPFGADLDITGERSLHQLLDTSLSDQGSKRLRDWLIAEVPDLALIQKRQRLIGELIPRTYFRDRISLEAKLVSPRWHGDLFLSWLKAEPMSSLSPLLIVILLGLSAASGLGFAAMMAGFSPFFWLLSWSLFLGLSAVYWRKTHHIFGEMLMINRQLLQFHQVARRLESYPYPAALGELCQIFGGQTRPSLHIRRMNFLTLGASLQMHGMMWLVLNVTLPWQIGLAWLLEREKGRLKDRFEAWFEVFYELEALNSLANFAALNPEYTFPQVGQGSPHLKAQALGHPLIPKAAKVCNDVSFAEDHRIFVLTGSNMSGKSSFLRTLGVNLALAYAGSVVNAQQLEVGSFRLFSSLRVNDSLIDGISFFYAEVRRLKLLLDAAQESEIPVFFLIDEIFRGTNNRERLEGSRAYIQALAATGSYGVVASHDLELTHIQHPALHNYHFREDVVGEKMVFDYHLWRGASPTTNALRIMELAGLPI